MEDQIRTESINDNPAENILDEPALLASPPRPWIRFWARSFDLYTFYFMVGIVWVFIDEKSLDKTNDTLLSIVLTFLWLFIEGACISLFGTTLGKKLLGISILNSDGNKLTPKQAFQRSRLVWWRGTGLGIGIPKLIACIMGHSRLVREGITTWDKEMGNIIVHRKVGWLKGLFVGTVFLLILSLTVYSYFV